MSKHSRFSVFTPLLICVFLIAACQQEAQELPTNTGESPTDVPASPIPPTETMAPEVQASNGCIDCHSDKQLLIDTAKPEEVVIAENEGEG